MAAITQLTTKTPGHQETPTASLGHLYTLYTLHTLHTRLSPCHLVIFLFRRRSSGKPPIASSANDVGSGTDDTA